MKKTILQETAAGQHFLTVPETLCKLKGWRKGTVLAWKIDDKGKIILQETK